MKSPVVAVVVALVVGLGAAIFFYGSTPKEERIEKSASKAISKRHKARIPKWGGQASPADLARVFLRAVGTPHAVTQLFPSEGLMRSTLRCGADRSTLNELIADLKEERARAVRKYGTRRRGARLTYRRTEFRRTTKEYQAGQALKGCTLNVGITIEKHKVYFVLNEGGKTTEESDSIKIMKIEGKGWYLIDP